MSLGRGLYLFRQVRSTLQPNSLIKTQVRNSSEGYIYRSSGGYVNKKWVPVSTAMMAVAWWWWLWHVYHEYDWVTGEWDVPDPRNWTDEELGIPPESE